MSGDPRPVGEDDLHGLIDGRLEPERQALVEAWLAGNPARAAEVSTDRVLRERLRARLAPIAEEAIPARLRVANIRSRHLYPGASWFPMAAAAVLCLALGGAGGWVGHALHGVPAVAVAEAPATQDAVAAFRTFVVEAAVHRWRCAPTRSPTS